MLASELDFDLPSELIAQVPVYPRHQARLMRVRRQDLLRQRDGISKALAHRQVNDLPSLLRPDDLLVFNDTRVLRARLRGRKVESGGKVESILLRQQALNVWEVLLKPSARLKIGTALEFMSRDQKLAVQAEPIERTQIGWLLRFFPPIVEEAQDTSMPYSWSDIREILAQLGEIPLPPYIHQSAAESDYQTVFARSVPLSGLDAPVALDSAAAPTAGLHFTPSLLAALAERGIQSTFITLGVGIGTFRPVQTKLLEDHTMHAEEFEIGAEAAALINAQKAAGGRVVAVGTTTTRVLESVAASDGQVQTGVGRTSIFIRPGFSFRCVDALMTNFHLPRSTLLAMVAAFMETKHSGPGATEEFLTGLESIRYAYNQAIAGRYRFFSFGDAMLIE